MVTFRIIAIFLLFILSFQISLADRCSKQLDSPENINLEQILAAKDVKIVDISFGVKLVSTDSGVQLPSHLVTYYKSIEIMNIRFDLTKQNLLIPHTSTLPSEFKRLKIGFLSYLVAGWIISKAKGFTLSSNLYALRGSEIDRIDLSPEAFALWKALEDSGFAVSGSHRWAFSGSKEFDNSIFKSENFLRQLKKIKIRELKKWDPEVVITDAQKNQAIKTSVKNNRTSFIMSDLKTLNIESNIKLDVLEISILRSDDEFSPLVAAALIIIHAKKMAAKYGVKKIILQGQFESMSSMMLSRSVLTFLISMGYSEPQLDDYSGNLYL